jgi:hypothetical protein
MNLRLERISFRESKTNDELESSHSETEKHRPTWPPFQQMGGAHLSAPAEMVNPLGYFGSQPSASVACANLKTED